jgi:hypothetical protein
MFIVGHRTRSKLLRGIFVILLCLVVSLTRSTTVRSKSRFSSGIRAINDESAFRRESEGGRIAEKVGIASVERDGGLRIGTGPALGPDGNAGPLVAVDVALVGEAASCARASVSAAIAASKYGCSSGVKMDSGTTFERISTIWWYCIGGPHIHEDKP